MYGSFSVKLCFRRGTSSGCANMLRLGEDASSHHLVHYKKDAKVSIIRKILIENMYGFGLDSDFYERNPNEKNLQ